MIVRKRRRKPHPRPRCAAALISGGNQCRCTKDLFRTRISVVRTPGFEFKLPEEAFVLLCREHLRLTPFEFFTMQESVRRKPKTKASV